MISDPPTSADEAQIVYGSMKWVVDDQCKNHFGNQFNVQVKREHPGNTIVVTAAVPPEDSILRTRCIIREYKATLENWKTVKHGLPILEHRELEDRHHERSFGLVLESGPAPLSIISRSS